MDHFLAMARQQSTQNWHGEYTARAAVNYVHDGFATSVPAPTPAPTPTPAPSDPPANNPEPPPAPHDWSAPSTPVASADVTDQVQIVRGAAAFTFEVTYVDPTGSPIDPVSIDATDLHLVGPKKFDQPATPVSTQALDNGALKVSYSVAPTTGTWERGNAGAYKLSMNGDQVRNAGGFAVEASDLASFKVAIAKALPVDKAPLVKRVKVNTRGAASVTFTFSENVSSSLDAGDLFLVSAADGSRLVAPEQQAVSYDAARNTATFTFPGLADAALPAGSKFHVVLAGSGVTDAVGQMLAGDKTGAAGVDYAPVKTFSA